MSEVSKKEDPMEEEVEEEPLVGEDEEEGSSGSFLQESHENVSGVISSDSHRWGLFFQFDVPGGRSGSTGRLCPIRSYVNGSRSLSEVCPTERELSLVFPRGSRFRMDVERRVSSKIVPTSSVSNPSSSLKEMDWSVKRIWKGEEEAAAELSWSQDKEDSFNRRLDKARERRLEPQAKGISDEELPEPETWFISLLSSPQFLPHPEEVPSTSAVGILSALLSPEGGLIQVKGGGPTVYFHRCRLFTSQKALKLSAATELKTVLKVGQELRLDYVPNKDDSGTPFMEGLQQEHIALRVYAKEGPVPDLPQVKFLKEEKYFIARILSFDEPGENGVASGLAEILRPTERNTNGYVKSTFKKMVNLDPAVKKVKFHRKELYHIGAPLCNADLRYFFSPYSYGLNIFFCHLSELKEVEGEVTHEVSLGWRTSTSFLHSTGRGALTIPPTVKEDSLLSIKSLSQCNTRFFGREGMDVPIYEQILEGRNVPYGEYFNGNEGDICEDYVPARISEICFPPGKNEGVARGFCIVQTGAHKGKRVEFSRENMSVFGFKPSEKTDLQYFIVLNEPCFVRFEEEEGESVKVKDLWIGAPRSAFLSDSDEGDMSYSLLTESARIKFFLFLESHDLSLKDFDEIITGRKGPRRFLPLSRESNRGVVIQLERALSKGKGRRLDLGAVSGVIKVENGPLAGNYVTFHRKNTWVMGYNMLKADLTHIFQKGQKVYLEAEELPSKEASRGPTPYEYKHRATLVWTSKFRPRNDLEPTSPEDKRSLDWLKKRNLDAEKFQQLVNGKLPIVNGQFAAKNGNNMLKYRDLQDMACGRIQPDGPPPVTPEVLPVLRHGPEAARICEAALSTTGPNDSRIMDIIRNDDNAQMAFHIHKALGFALEHYTSQNGGSSFSMSNDYEEGPSFNGNQHSSSSYRTPSNNSSHHHNNNNFNDNSNGSYNYQSYASSNGSQNGWNNNNLNNNGGGGQYGGQQQGNRGGGGAPYPLMGGRGNNAGSRGMKRQGDGNGYGPGMKKSRGGGMMMMRGGGGGMNMMNRSPGRGGGMNMMKNQRGGRGGGLRGNYRN
eukprot:TRINITY_DN1921_c0_g1_i1.p1 TRINITY_DN1921_c0_g1~~TRINITY_DN1921_c0_g1_i1.p1  ORF type:complete len:1063 (-),score=402.13 TRINITY_DN1921_c0_g1_i1:608-3796(-)